MNKKTRIREILEPEAPRLDEASASRIESAVEEAIARRRARRRLFSWRPSLALPAIGVPALAILLLLLLKPFGAEDGAPRLTLLNEEQLIARLEQLLDEDSDPESIYYGDDADFEDFNEENWTDDDWNAFNANLEDFQLSDTGGVR